jgi:hypothetical protein
VTIPGGALSSKLVWVRSFIKKTVRHINRAQYYPRLTEPSDLVVLALASKALVVGSAVCNLVEADFYEEAFGLTRTLVEIYLNLRYITNEGNSDRAETYANFFAKDHEGWTNLIQRYYPANPLNLPSHHAEMMKIAKRYKHPHSWSGLPGQVKAMAVEEDKFENDPSGKPLKCEFDYEVIYKWTSHYVHATVVAIDTHAVEARTPFAIHSRKRFGIRLKELALFNTVVYLTKILLRSFSAIGRQVPRSISEEADRLLKSF